MIQDLFMARNICRNCLVGRKCRGVLQLSGVRIVRPISNWVKVQIQVLELFVHTLHPFPIRKGKSVIVTLFL